MCVLIFYNFFLKESHSTKNIKFHENPSSGSQVVPCGQTDGQTNLKVALCNFTNMSK